MSEANGSGPTIVVVTPGEETPGGSGEGEQVEARAEAAVVAEVADSAVQIAEIEAERDITLAAISAETTETIVTAEQNEELERCRLRIAELEGLSTAQMEELQTLRAQLIPPLSQEPPPSPPPPVESAEEAGPRESQEAAPVEEPPKVKRKPLRWI